LVSYNTTTRRHNPEDHDLNLRAVKASNVALAHTIRESLFLSMDRK